MNIKLIIFDFDGTIMDTKNTIIAAKQETLRQMGVDVAMNRHVQVQLECLLK